MQRADIVDLLARAHLILLRDKLWVDEKQQQSQNFSLRANPPSTFRENFFQPVTIFLLMRDKLITQGEKRETSTRTWTMLSDKLKVFCTSYFVASLFRATSSNAHK